VSQSPRISQSGQITTVEMAALYVRPNFADLVVVTQDTRGGNEAFYHDHVDKISIMNTEGSL